MGDVRPARAASRGRPRRDPLPTPSGWPDHLYERKRVADRIRSAGSIPKRPATPGSSTPRPGRRDRRPQLDWRPGDHRRRRQGRRLPIPGAELGLTDRGPSQPQLPAWPSLRHRSGRYGLSAHVDPGRLRLRCHARRVRPTDRAASGCRRLGRARKRFCATWHRDHHQRRSSATPAGSSSWSASRADPVGDESRTVDVDAAFFAVGWPGNADVVDAAAAGAATERGYVVVDPFTATSVPHIFAAWDVDGNSMLVSSAMLEGPRRRGERGARPASPGRP